MVYLLMLRTAKLMSMTSFFLVIGSWLTLLIVRPVGGFVNGVQRNIGVVVRKVFHGHLGNGNSRSIHFQFLFIFRNASC